MEHLELKATTTATDQEAGTFEALVSSWVEDRQRDVILETAFDKTISAWRQSGRNLPLLFEHSVKAIGSIDPASMHTNGEGLVVSGEVDRSTEEGEQAWRMVKNNTASFSIGFMSESRRRKGRKGREIYEIDLLEVSLTATPVNASARVLNWKSAATIESELSEEELQTYEALRAEWEAKREAKAQEEEPQPYRQQLIPFRPLDPEKVISICGVRVKAGNITVNGRRQK